MGGSQVPGAAQIFAQLLPDSPRQVRVSGGVYAARMAQGKKVTKQTLIGEKGIALISRRCLDMGYLFHPRRVTMVLTATLIS